MLVGDMLYQFVFPRNGGTKSVAMLESCTCLRLIAPMLQVALQNQPMSWITPLGLPVVQPYRRNNALIVKTLLQDVQVRLDRNPHLLLVKERLLRTAVLALCLPLPCRLSTRTTCCLCPSHARGAPSLPTTCTPWTPHMCVP